MLIEPKTKMLSRVFPSAEGSATAEDLGVGDEPNLPHIDSTPFGPLRDVSCKRDICKARHILLPLFFFCCSFSSSIVLSTDNWDSNLCAEYR
jgi:hypothetical protein